MTIRKSGVLAAATVILTAGIAAAHTRCCEGEACPASAPYASPGSAPADARCCTDAALTSCSPAANAGWACAEIDPRNSSAPSGAIAGCAQDDTTASCIGGAVTPGGAAGCVGVAGALFIAGSDAGASPDDCTRAAVAACCAADACVHAPAD